jgi:hypothetical protein
MKAILNFYSIFLLNIIIVLLTESIHSKLIKENVIAAINCGGPEYTDEDGIVYEKDNYFDYGISSDHGLNYDIENTQDMDLYQSERWHSDTFTYSVPVKNAGKYILILKFSEVYFSQPNEKVFDVALGKKIIIKDMDIFKKAGKATAHDEFIEFEIKDDKCYVNKQEAPAAYDSKTKQLKIKFIKGPKDNPKINAILVYKGDILDTEYAEKKKKLDEENRKKLQEVKKKYLIEKKHSPEEVYDEDAALMEDNSIIVQEEQGLFGIFFTYHGVLILISFGLFLALNYALESAEIKKY